MDREEDYIDDEYIDNENDPSSVEEITKEDYLEIEKEEVVEHEDILASPKSTSAELVSNRDYSMNEKVLDALRKGAFSKCR